MTDNQYRAQNAVEALEYELKKINNVTNRTETKYTDVANVDTRLYN